MITYRRVNHVLLGLILLINGYIIAAPFFPRLLFWYHEHTGTTVQKLEQQAKTQPADPQPNSLIIPSMLLNGQVYEGRDTYAELNKGVWRWPGSSTPDKGGNTVLVGHRFTYTNPRGIFYFLNKVEKGSEMGVIWNNKLYTYQVVDVETVPPTQTSILRATKEPTLTLYTCTPLWNPKNRLVVTARLET